MIHLTRVDAGRNMARFYRMEVQPTLLGDWSLITQWGRIGSRGRVQERTFTDEVSASMALSDRLSVKARRGYKGLP